MAARRKRPPPKKTRQRQTQTKRRDLLIKRVEREYTREIIRVEERAQRTVEAWIAQNAGKETAAGLTALLGRVERLFKDPKNMRAFFGRIASLVDQDVQSIMTSTIPTIKRVDVLPPKLLDRFSRQNAQLIKSVPNIAADRLGEIIKSGAATGDTLQREIQKAFGVSQSKAEFWARDQTLKLHADITQTRHRQAGIDRYYWTTSGDERVRDVHRELGDASDAGVTYDYRKPPVFSEDGRRGNPGEDYNCRCTAYPVL